MQSVIDYFEKQTYNFSSRSRYVFSYTRQFVIDGETTRRNKIEQLSKAEKTMLGIKFEQMFKQVFKLESGNNLDCSIFGKEFDIKFTCRKNWMIPPKCFNKICLLAKMSESRCSLGIVQVDESILTESSNWDRKKSIRLRGKDNIYWFFEEEEL